jgi:site-specific DNA-methyltransferase (adenine-specific)
MTVETNRIYQGDCLDVMASWPENFVDTIITDPPYGLSFMGKDWDHGVPGHHFWAEALRIAKPGAFLLAFGGTRTYHRLAVAIEDAGWQIRDCLMWLYGSGFPKSHNLHGTFEGWGTALKPAWEPIIVAMKPTDGTFAENAEKWGVAGINVDGGRIGCREETQITGAKQTSNAYGKIDVPGGKVLPDGRWPANLILDEDAAAMLDGQSGASSYTGTNTGGLGKNGIYSPSSGLDQSRIGFGDRGGASRFFYVAKADRAERNEGCEGMPVKAKPTLNDYVNPSQGRTAPKNGSPASNHHPTVKPLSLMKYLCNLTKTPTGGIVLDPFCGSGTTLWAAEYHNRPWIGIEDEH